MIVCKSHSRKDLIILFKNHGVSINNMLNKCDIINKIDEYIKFFIYDDIIKDETELRNFLKNKSNKQRPSLQEKNIIMFKAKKIIKWSKNNYILDGLYTNFEEAYNDVMEIHKWGDLPTIRKACKLYNISPSRKNHINPIMSSNVLKSLENQIIFKEEFVPCLKINKKQNGDMFYIHFD